MATILLTGASGFLGQAVLADLAQRHEVVTFCRRKLTAGKQQTHYCGVFSEVEDLRQLDAHAFDAVVHLAATTGGCSEREGILVNVEGTRCLMRYLLNRGCRKFVNASSIAVVGLQSVDYRPPILPIPNESPCLDRHGYGLSKYLMEEVTRYLQRQTPEADVINLRLATIYADEQAPQPFGAGAVFPWAAAAITQMSRTKAVEALVRAVESPQQAGLRILNAVSRRSWVDQPVIDVLRSWWGNDFATDGLDLASYDAQPSLFDSTAIERELGFVAE